MIKEKDFSENSDEEIVKILFFVKGQSESVHA